MENINLPTKNTWCPGCGNFGIQRALTDAVSEMDRRKAVLVSGIGCHGKMSDYLNMNSFYSLHGRAIAAGAGIKLGNEELDVICSVGDGDAYSEGIAHLVHAARRNSNITVLVHDNHVFSLTVKQRTATSPKGFAGSTTPKGSVEDPMNPLKLMLDTGATFVARGYSAKADHLKRLILEGVRHQGFSYIEVLQPCIAWYNTYESYNERVYEMENEFMEIKDAKEKAAEWDYNNPDVKIPLGVFYKEEKDTFENQTGGSFFVDVNSVLEKTK